MFSAGARSEPAGIPRAPTGPSAREPRVGIATPCVAVSPGSAAAGAAPASRTRAERALASVPYAVVESIKVTAGSARTEHGRAIYDGTVPKRCPGGGFPVKTEAIFDEGGANPPVPETFTVAFKAPCPRR